MSRFSLWTIVAITLVSFCASAQESDTALLKLSDAKDAPQGRTADNSANQRQMPALHTLPNSKQTSNVNLPPDPVTLPRKSAVKIEHKKNSSNNE